ncbi:MAG: prolipoprotein diacylglyceryl transferase [Candidatus Omnitrophota bacterium]
MYPIICKIGPLTIYSYGLFLFLAFSIAAFLLSREAKIQGLCPELIFNFSFIILISGIIGSRLLYIILNPGYYLENPLQIIMLQRGGLAWFGGLILAIPSSIIYLRNKHLDVYKIFDLAIPFIALGQAVGRIGCFFNGCCFGKASSNFGIYSQAHDLYLIPTQLYSSLLLIGIYIALRIKQARIYSRVKLKGKEIVQKHKGEIFYTYLFLYSLKRFFIEFLRGDSRDLILGLRVFHALSIVLFVSSVIMLIRIKRRN